MNTGRHLDAVRMPGWRAFLRNWLIVLIHYHALIRLFSSLSVDIRCMLTSALYGCGTIGQLENIREDAFQRGSIIAGEMNVYRLSQNNGVIIFNLGI
jgi:hypothetical protein